MRPSPVSNSLYWVATFLAISDLCLGSHIIVKRQSFEGNELRILPDGPQHKPVGKNFLLTCKASVKNPELVRDLKWFGPGGQKIPEDDRIYTEEKPGDAAIMLFIKHLREEESGLYTCEGIYANNEKMTARVQISTYIGITWDDAPVEQNAVIHTDYKVRCVVRASPPATIDWLKESLIISTGNRYVIETDGLLIKHITPEDAGTYTCRAKVLERGSLEERDIKLEVHVPPTWIQEPRDVRGIEQDKGDFHCNARGTPNPAYTWVDWEGRSALTRKGWTMDKDTGHLIAHGLKREDEGIYTCIAENPAGRIESKASLDVIIKPKVQELFNKTLGVGMSRASIICKASGDPMPDVIWRKWSNNDPFIPGGQPTNDRIFVENRLERAPDYTEGETEWRVSELMISDVQREDDGLYECQARNEGGKFFKSGHIQVEFAPTFEETPMRKEYSWDQHPINLTCIATAIPNATIIWYYREREIGKEIIDRNYQITQNGPRSDLKVTPLETQYYGRYSCLARNKYGEAQHEIELQEAREPSSIRQAVTDKTTATTIQFRFVSPSDTGGLPIDSYAAEYKEATKEWNGAERRVWPASQFGVYILESLYPRTTYDFRFAAKNLVGYSEWSAGQQFTMPQRGPPETPIIDKRRQNVSDNVLTISSPTRYELSWMLPEDNGEPIDYFEISFYPVAYNTETMSWSERGNLFRTEVPHPGNVRFELKGLYPDTYHMVEIRAHNHMGFSPASTIIIKTAQVSGRITSMEGDGEALPTPWQAQRASVSLGIIIGAIFIILLIGCILTDIICCKVNRRGLTYLICDRAQRSSKDKKRNSQKRVPPVVCSEKRVPPGIKEKQEIIGREHVERGSSIKSSQSAEDLKQTIPLVDVNSHDSPDFDDDVQARVILPQPPKKKPSPLKPDQMTKGQFASTTHPAPDVSNGPSTIKSIQGGSHRSRKPSNGFKNESNGTGYSLSSQNELLLIPERKRNELQSGGHGKHQPGKKDNTSFAYLKHQSASSSQLNDQVKTSSPDKHGHPMPSSSQRFQSEWSLTSSAQPEDNSKRRKSVAQDPRVWREEAAKMDQQRRISVYDDSGYLEPDRCVEDPLYLLAGRSQNTHFVAQESLGSSQQAYYSMYDVSARERQEQMENWHPQGDSSTSSGSSTRTKKRPHWITKIVENKKESSSSDETRRRAEKQRRAVLANMPRPLEQGPRFQKATNGRAIKRGSNTKRPLTASKSLDFYDNRPSSVDEATGTAFASTANGTRDSGDPSQRPSMSHSRMTGTTKPQPNVGGHAWSDQDPSIVLASNERRPGLDGHDIISSSSESPLISAHSEAKGFASPFQRGEKVEKKPRKQFITNPPGNSEMAARSRGHPEELGIKPRVSPELTSKSTTASTLTPFSDRTDSSLTTDSYSSRDVSARLGFHDPNAGFQPPQRAIPSSKLVKAQASGPMARGWNRGRSNARRPASVHGTSFNLFGFLTSGGISNGSTKGSRGSRQSSESNFQNLHDLTRSSRNLAHSTDIVNSGTLSPSGRSKSGGCLYFDQFKQTRDFGDFQTYSTSPFHSSNNLGSSTSALQQAPDSDLGPPDVPPRSKAVRDQRPDVLPRNGEEASIRAASEHQVVDGSSHLRGSRPKLNEGIGRSTRV